MTKIPLKTKVVNQYVAGDLLILTSHMPKPLKFHLGSTQTGHRYSLCGMGRGGVYGLHVACDTEGSALLSVPLDSMCLKCIAKARQE